MTRVPILCMISGQVTGALLQARQELSQELQSSTDSRPVYITTKDKLPRLKGQGRRIYLWEDNRIQKYV